MRFAAPSRVATPLISGTAQAVTITCNTPSASIYYTTDGTFPWLGNPTASLYGVTYLVVETGAIIVTQNGDPLNAAIPLVVSAGTYVRAAAYASGKQGSDVAAITF